MTPPDKYRARTLYQALHLEKQVSRELAKLVQAQEIIIQTLREKIAEMEKE